MDYIPFECPENLIKYGAIQGLVDGVRHFESTAYYDPQGEKCYYRFNNDNVYQGKWATEAHLAMLGLPDPDRSVSILLESVLNRQGDQ